MSPNWKPKGKSLSWRAVIKLRRDATKVSVALTNHWLAWEGQDKSCQNRQHKVWQASCAKSLRKTQPSVEVAITASIDRKKADEFANRDLLRASTGFAACSCSDRLAFHYLGISTVRKFLPNFQMIQRVSASPLFCPEREFNNKTKYLAIFTDNFFRVIVHTINLGSGGISMKFSTALSCAVLVAVAISCKAKHQTEGSSVKEIDVEQSSDTRVGRFRFVTTCPIGSDYQGNSSFSHPRSYTGNFCKGTATLDEGYVMESAENLVKYNFREICPAQEVEVLQSWHVTLSKTDVDDVTDSHLGKSFICQAVEKIFQRFSGNEDLNISGVKLLLYRYGDAYIDQNIPELVFTHSANREVTQEDVSRAYMQAKRTSSSTNLCSGDGVEVANSCWYQTTNPEQSCRQQCNVLGLQFDSAAPTPDNQDEPFCQQIAGAFKQDYRANRLGNCQTGCLTRGQVVFTCKQANISDRAPYDAIGGDAYANASTLWQLNRFCPCL